MRRFLDKLGSCLSPVYRVKTRSRLLFPTPGAISSEKRERANSKVDYWDCTWLYLQIVVYVRHVRSIAERLDERLLRLRDASLSAQHTAQITISCNNHNGTFVTTGLHRRNEKSNGCYKMEILLPFRCYRVYLYTSYRI